MLICNWYIAKVYFYNVVLFQIHHFMNYSRDQHQKEKKKRALLVHEARDMSRERDPNELQKCAFLWSMESKRKSFQANWMLGFWISFSLFWFHWLNPGIHWCKADTQTTEPYPQGQLEFWRPWLFFSLFQRQAQVKLTSLLNSHSINLSLSHWNRPKRT